MFFLRQINFLCTKNIVGAYNAKSRKTWIIGAKRLWNHCKLERYILPDLTFMGTLSVTVIPLIIIDIGGPLS